MWWAAWTRQRSGGWPRAWPALGGLLAAQPALAVTPPEDRAEALLHVYDGAGTRATGPAVLVRKSLADRVQLSGSLYVDMVSNASIDVVTTASPYRERRTAADLALQGQVRDATLKLSLAGSSEPDYRVRSVALDATQEVFGGMTTLNLGFTRSADDVGKTGSPEFADAATHWQWRVGATQVLSPRWLATAALEVLADDGFLGSPYRVARVFGAAVPERTPRTRTGRALALGLRGDVQGVGVLRADYRYFWDTWEVHAHTLEFGAARRFGPAWTAEAALRWHRQDAALFYSDNAQAETRYVSRNRQLATFSNLGLQAKLSHAVTRIGADKPVWLTGSYEFKRLSYRDFTDLRTGEPYAHNAHLLQLYVAVDF